MTIKELYEEARKLDRDDWEIFVFDYYGSASKGKDLDWGTGENGEKAVMILP